MEYFLTVYGCGRHEDSRPGLQMTRRSLLRRGAQPEPANLFPANRIELGLGSEQQPVAGDRWRGQRHFVLRIDAQRLEPRAGFHDVRRAFLVQAKDLAVVRPRRGGECPAAAIARQPALVTLFARLRVESGQDAHFVEYV